VMGPLVSIVIPIYNVEKYLEECLNSVINQTYKSIEVILVDDGSTDRSGVIADRLARDDARLTVIHKSNGGLSDARNVGMRLAKGKYITFVDSDDYVDERFIEKILTMAERSSADIVQCNNSRSSDQLGKGSNKFVAMSGRDAFVKLMKFRIVSPTAWGKLYRLSLFRDNNLEFPVGRLHEDTAILYKLVYFASSIICLDMVLYYYRINSNSIMSSAYTKNHHESVVKYHEELDNFIYNNQVTINETTIYKHKALRLLSVLNKLAQHRAEATNVYSDFRLEYVKFFVKSRSIVCLFGITPIFMPGIFRIVSRATPTIRRILGKT
jgi:glycosyltransferase involved in cell wall biosynthesis